MLTIFKQIWLFDIRIFSLSHYSNSLNVQYFRKITDLKKTAVNIFFFSLYTSGYTSGGLTYSVG